MARWKVLVAAGCIAVLAVAGLWGWREWKVASEREAAAMLEAEQEAAKTQAGREGLQTECEAEIAAWDSGDRDALLNRLGSHAEDRIERCRGIVAMEVE